MSQGPYVYPYPRPMVTVDTVVFACWKNRLKVLLIQRGQEPFKGFWALPGGFLDMEEEPAVSAARELREETGLQDVPLVQCATFGSVHRDPRGRVLTIAYTGFVPGSSPDVAAGDDAAAAGWMPLATLPPLACDHKDIIGAALAWWLTQCIAQADPVRYLPAECGPDLFREMLAGFGWTNTVLTSQ